MYGTCFDMHLGHLQECQHKNQTIEGILAYVEYRTYPIGIKRFQKLFMLFV